MSDQNSPETTDGPVLPERPGGRPRNILIAVIAVAAVVLSLGLWAVFANLGDSEADAGANGPTQDESDGETGASEEEPVTVRIGTTDISQPHWAILADLAAEENITLDFVGFSEYTQPNPALAQGELELNSFQHILYLADHNVNTGDDLRPVGSTIIVPLPLYSHTYDTVEEFQPGDEVAIPSDSTNQARALLVLESAGLIAFTGDPVSPTPEDIDTDASTIEVTPVEASQTATLIDQLAGVVVNNNFAQDAGFDLESYVFADDPEQENAQPYINIFAARGDDVDNPVYQRIVELYHTPEVLDAVQEESGGTASIVEGFDGPALQDLLAETEERLLEEP